MKRNLFFLLIWPFALISQEKKTGPIITDYGPVWTIENTDFETPIEAEYKVVFDIMNSPEDVSKRNASIETAARFLNMHAQAGVSIQNLKVALVVHNKASKDLLSKKAYFERYNIENPNADMIAQLMDANVQFIFCGQSSASRNIPIKETIPGVQLGLSAMTALIQLQNEGYRLIKF
ncbi:DsrE family protein [Croceivirga thetidis]|uniref:DsrE family protein n=1 Tax=Croceivirga thetidis TaxID=2721623 RepID=A0ABX1GR73_9FLAO|nr:DsrE family protein [Croceivirga thetidis]NKI32435.1 DsrE family protein [Croceivirga thetidis]